MEWPVAQPFVDLADCAQMCSEFSLSSTDDKVYGRSMLSALVAASAARPDAAIGYAGISMSTTTTCFFIGCKGNSLTPIPVLEGFAGVLYPRGVLGSADALTRAVRYACRGARFQSQAIKSTGRDGTTLSLASCLLPRRSRTCQLGDDVLISEYLASHGVARFRLVLAALNQHNK